jgi:DNA invertase Pin-like site-specific DNA recombinase
MLIMAKNYAIYDRTAMALQASDLPSDRQIERCKAIVAKLGGNLTHVFQDIGVGGQQYARAPARDRLMDRIKAGGIDYVVVPDLSRLSRSAVTVMEITSDIKAAGVELLIAHDPKGEH